MDNVAFAVIWKRPYKVLYSYAQRRYTVVCDKERCPWRFCARKQNITGKWKIIKIVSPHNCANHELTVRHRQLTSTLIAKRMMGILKEQPNMKIRTIIRIVAEIYGAWQMIYGDWESGYEQPPVLFNTIKAMNPSMHYEYIPKPNAWKDARQIFERAFWCFPQCVEAFRHYRPVFSIDGTFFISKYRGTLLIAISCDANNMLVPLAFAVVDVGPSTSWSSQGYGSSTVGLFAQQRLSSRFRRAAARCGCSTATMLDVHVPSPREGGVGSSRKGPSRSRAIASEDEDDDDEDNGDQRPEELDLSQLQDAPLTQPT
uniref:Uncharacterized protein n=1 Tax=Setaria italica TaxID=4555 RepID=K3ZCW5_SETIT